jgi:multiple antibiotic resistance protein
MEILLATFSALFPVINPFGATPVFLALTGSMDKTTRNEQAMKACLYVVGILVVFFFAGTFILNFFGLRIEDLRIAGGILITRSGLSLLNPDDAHKGSKRLSKEVQQEGLEKEDISFTPLAMPLLSGPGSIAVVIGMYNKATCYQEVGFIIAAIILVAIASYLILRSSQQFTRFLGKSGMAALSRMMGFIVLSIGVSFILNGVLSLVNMYLER